MYLCSSTSMAPAPVAPASPGPWPQALATVVVLTDHQWWGSVTPATHLEGEGDKDCLQAGWWVDGLMNERMVGGADYPVPAKR